MNPMKRIVADSTMLYDGSQINPLWSYEYLDVRGDSIIVFRGAMDVRYVKDIEDEKNRKQIKGDDLIHLIVERFDPPASIRQAYYLQRMLVICVQDVLRDLGVITKRSGDDLFVDGKKLTVSIATAGISSEKIHCGINLTSQGTPVEANAIGLYELGIDADSWKDIGNKIAERFLKSRILNPTSARRDVWTGCECDFSLPGTQSRHPCTREHAGMTPSVCNVSLT